MAGIDANTVYLLHMDGSDTSTTFTDSSGTSKTATAAGNAQIDTAQSVFGGASGLFDGNGDYLTTPDSDDFYFGTGDFTIDFRTRIATRPSNGTAQYFCSQVQDANNWWGVSIYNNAGTYQIGTSATVGSSVKVTAYKNVTFNANTWYHIAVVRSGTSFMIFQDGTQAGTTTTDADAYPQLTGTFDIARWSGGSYINGWIDEFRVSKGIARWTTNFTPPTEAYSLDGGFLTTNSKFW
jgi:hypothetical protein